MNFPTNTHRELQQVTHFCPNSQSLCLGVQEIYLYSSLFVSLFFFFLFNPLFHRETRDDTTIFEQVPMTRRRHTEMLGVRGRPVLTLRGCLLLARSSRRRTKKPASKRYERGADDPESRLWTFTNASTLPIGVTTRVCTGEERVPPLPSCSILLSPSPQTVPLPSCTLSSPLLPQHYHYPLPLVPLPQLPFSSTSTLFSSFAFFLSCNST